MTTKEYLNQAFRIDQRIESKLEQIENLKTLATKVSSTLSDMPKSPNNGSRVDDIVVKIVMLEDQIKTDVDRLVTLKRDISEVISKVEPMECRIVLELRYLSFCAWEDIALKMNCSTRNVLFLHKKGLFSAHEYIRD